MCDAWHAKLYVTDEIIHVGFPEEVNALQLLHVTRHPPLLYCVSRHTTQVEQVFLRVAMQAKQLGGLVPALVLFIRTNLGPWLAEQGDSYAVGKVPVGELLRRAHSAEMVLASARGASSSRLAGASPDDGSKGVMMDEDLMGGPGSGADVGGIIRAGEGESEDDSDLESESE
jgi:hypothetical protein